MKLIRSLSSNSDDLLPMAKLFDRRRSIHAVLGGGRVADTILWRNKSLSAAILMGATVIWFLMEVVEYKFLALLCHASIIAMLAIFIWSNGAPLFDWPTPKIPDIILSKRAFKEVALSFHAILRTSIDVASGKDLKLFFLALAALWMLSEIGSYFNFPSLLYFGILCIHTIPVLYERYERDVDYLAGRGNRDVKKLYWKFDSKILRRIPRGPTKEKKLK